MQYTPHYNLNLPEGTDIVNPLIQDNPNYSAIDAALYANKQRVVGTATHTKTGTNHSIVLADSDIPVFRFVATGDYATGDTFSVDGVTVTARIADGSSIPTGAFKINSTVEAILDGTILNLINVDGTKTASDVSYDNTLSGLNAVNVQGAIDELANPGSASVTADGVKTWSTLFNELFALVNVNKISVNTCIQIDDTDNGHRVFSIIKWYRNYLYKFTQTEGAPSPYGVINEVIDVMSSASTYVRYTPSGTAITYTGQVCPATTVITIKY